VYLKTGMLLATFYPHLFSVKPRVAVSPLVIGFGGACYTCHSSHGAAEVVFARARKVGHVHITP
jgi:hypothetical protein